MPRKELKEFKPHLTERKELALSIMELSLKGYTPKEIALQLRVGQPVVRSHLNAIEAHFLPAQETSLLYRKNERLAKLQLLEKEIWLDIEKHKEHPTQVAALRRILMTAYELGAKLEGLISEKVQVGADAALKKLLEEVRNVEVRDNHHLPVEAFRDCEAAKKDGDKAASVREVAASVCEAAFPDDRAAASDYRVGVL